MTQVKVITLSMEDFRKEMEMAKVDILKSFIEATGGINWNQYKPLMTKKEVAELFRKSLDTIDAWVDKGILKASIVEMRIAGIHKTSVMALFYNKK